MKEKHPKISAIIVGTNEIRWLAECITSLINSSYPNFQIIYVDNASTDGSVVYVRENFSKTYILESKKNLGFAGANNLGIRHAISIQSKYCFLVNADTKVSPDLISDLSGFMQLFPSYGIIGPMQTDYYNPVELNAWSRQALVNQEKHAFCKWDPNKKSNFINKGQRAPNTLEHSYVQGAAFFFRTAMISKTGLLDEIYHTYYEEVDLCRKSRWKGLKVALITNLYIQHFGGGGSVTKSAYRNYHYSRNKYIYLFTEPEYNFKEIASLTSRWIKNDFKKSIAKKKTDICSLRQFVAIICWLLFKLPRLFQMRKENKKMIANTT